MSDLKMSKCCGAMKVVNSGDHYCGVRYGDGVFICKDCKIASQAETIAKLQADVIEMSTLAATNADRVVSLSGEVIEKAEQIELLREALVNMKEDYLVSMDSPFSQLEYDDELMSATNNALAATAKG